MYTNLSAPTLRNLRRMMPKFTLSHTQALRVAERQAVRLARYFDAECRVITETDLASITRLSIERSCGHQQCPISGHSYYADRTWHISVEACEPRARQRFTIAHELKHIIDAGCRLDHLYRHLSTDQIERVCDYFAANLLMSKHAVYHLWGEGLRTPEALAMACHVSLSAMKRRMRELALPLDLDQPPLIDLHYSHYSDAFPDADQPDTLPTHLTPDSTGAAS